MSKILEFLILSALAILLCIAVASCTSIPFGDNVSHSPADTLVKVVNKTSWMPMLSILGIASGVFAFLNGFKWGIPAIAACSVGLFMSLATARYSQFMAISGLVGSILITVGSIIVKNQALVEIITGVQRIKEQAKIAPIDNPKVINNVLSNYQNKHTKHTIKNVKKKMAN